MNIQNIELPKCCPHFENHTEEIWCRTCVRDVLTHLVVKIGEVHKHAVDVIVQLKDADITEVQDALSDVMEDQETKDRAVDALRQQLHEKNEDNKALADDIYVKEKLIKQLENDLQYTEEVLASVRQELRDT